MELNIAKTPSRIPGTQSRPLPRTAGYLSKVKWLADVAHHAGPGLVRLPAT